MSHSPAIPQDTGKAPAPPQAERQHDAVKHPPVRIGKVIIRGIDMDFWLLVWFFVKAGFAFLTALAFIALVLLVVSAATRITPADISLALVNLYLKIW